MGFDFEYANRLIEERKFGLQANRKGYNSIGDLITFLSTPYRLVGEKCLGGPISTSEFVRFWAELSEEEQEYYRLADLTK
jgi:hypothetical protein